MENTSDSDKEKTAIEFSSFEISDKVFEYANPSNQTFINIKGNNSLPLVTITKLKESEINHGQK